MRSNSTYLLIPLMLAAALVMTPIAADAATDKNLAGYTLGPGKYTFELPKRADAIKYTVELTNGAARGKDRVSAAVVTIGATGVFSQKDFNQNVLGLSADLTPSEYGSGLMMVEIRGRPGSQLEIKISALVPDEVRVDYYRDYDLDTYGNPATRIILPQGAPPPPGPPVGSPGYFKWVNKGGDCNDRNPNIYPGNGCPPLR